VSKKYHILKGDVGYGNYAEEKSDDISVPENVDESQAVSLEQETEESSITADLINTEQRANCEEK